MAVAASKIAAATQIDLENTDGLFAQGLTQGLIKRGNGLGSSGF